MNITTKIVPKIKFREEINKINQFPKTKLIKKKLTIKNNSTDSSNNELNQSWDFTPFPKLYFPSEKKHAIREINNLNFQNTLNQNSPTNINYLINYKQILILHMYLKVIQYQIYSRK